MSKWVTSWACAQTGCQIFISPLAGKTTRCRLTNSLAGKAVRVRLANYYGKASVQIEKASIKIGERKFELTVDGKSDFIVPKSGALIADQKECPVRPGDIIEIRMYTKDDMISGSLTGNQEHSITGDYTQSESFDREENQIFSIQGEPAPSFGEPVFLIQGVDVLTEEDAYAVAAFGDSITQMGFWFKPLQEDIFQNGGGKVSVLNLGISGNRLLRGMPGKHILGEAFGDAAVMRAYYDVLRLSGIKKVLIALGVNDISQPGADGLGEEGIAEMPSVNQMIRGYQFLADYFRDSGMEIYAATITPFEGFGSCDATVEDIRNQINNWMRETDIFDGVFDFDTAVADPLYMSRLKADFDSGDHLHPNEDGGQAMYQMIDSRIKVRHI